MPAKPNPNPRYSFNSNQTDELTSLLSRQGSNVNRTSSSPNKDAPDYLSSPSVDNSINNANGSFGSKPRKSPRAAPPSRRATSRISLTWTDLVYEAQVPKTKEAPSGVKKILQSVTGHVSSGQMLAILGPSGAGKTTMLDILASRQKGGTVKGELLMNGQPINDGVFRRVSAYVQQEDILHSYLTVRETIRYAARLRTSSEVTNEEIEVKVQNVMEILGIDHVADRKIGGEFVRGVSGGEKKRTAIAVELVNDPALIYLDEPTTGLDTFTAMHLLFILKNLTKLGVAVVFSIHQPRSTIFRLFDTVLLLNGYGEEAYFGAASNAMPFMESIGVVCKEPDNPADFLLDSVSVIRAAENLNKEDFPFLPPPSQSQDIAAAFRSTTLDSITQEVEDIKQLFVNDCQLPEALSSPYYRPIWTQIGVVSQRALLNKLRDPIATVIAIVVAMLFAVLVGSIYFRLPETEDGAHDRTGVLFFLTMNTAFSNLGSLAIFLFDRSIYVREHRNGMYRPSAYYIGKIVQDIPFGILVTFCFSAIAYFMVGLQNTMEKFSIFFAISVLVMLNSYGICMFISNMSKNYQVANVIAPLILVLYLIPSGFLINLNSIPIIWRWIKYISFFRYGFEALVINEFVGLNFECTNLATNTTMHCTGEQYIAMNLGFEGGDLSENIILIAASAAVYMILGYIMLRLFRRGEGK